MTWKIVLPSFSFPCDLWHVSYELFFNHHISLNLYMNFCSLLLSFSLSRASGQHHQHFQQQYRKRHSIAHLLLLTLLTRCNRPSHDHSFILSHLLLHPENIHFPTSPSYIHLSFSPLQKLNQVTINFSPPLFVLFARASRPFTFSRWNIHPSSCLEV